LEVAEAIAVMTGADSPTFALQGLATQWELVTRFLYMLIAEEFGLDTGRLALKRAERMKETGALLPIFTKLLEVHGVAIDVAHHVSTAPMDYFFRGRLPERIIARQRGTVVALDQRRLGNIVNFEMGAGANDFGGAPDLRAGVVLNVQSGQRVEAGDVLCWGYCSLSNGLGGEICESIGDCFEILPSLG